ncbi:hypothetical protein [Flavobacterium sp. 2]|uniref:hypothetical protein n=1 Tax=Flavobacterium sp. 2 TaxID=308053 RepID=UPI003CE7EA75
MNEQTKSTTLTVPETLTLNCKNLIINASESITTTAGMNITENVTLNKTSIVGGVLNTSVTGDNFLRVVGDSHTDIDGDSHSDVKKSRNVAAENKIITRSESGHEFHSEKDIKNNSSENTTQN